MQQVSDTYVCEYEVKRSTFTSYLLPYSRFESTLATLKKEHPKASHIVWAYRVLNAYGQITENSTDDGEPKGCAGNPTLAQMRGYDLIESALITVRYFGGIKLGTGGMVRAYSSAAKAVITSAQMTPFEKREPYTMEVAYALLKRYEHFLQTHAIEIGARTFEADRVVWRLQLTQEERRRLEAFRASLL